MLTLALVLPLPEVADSKEKKVSLIYHGCRCARTGRKSLASSTQQLWPTPGIEW